MCGLLTHIHQIVEENLAIKNFAAKYNCLLLTSQRGPRTGGEKVHLRCTKFLGYK